MKEDNYKPKKPIPRQRTEDAIISDADGGAINVSAILRSAGVDEMNFDHVSQ